MERLSDREAIEYLVHETVGLERLRKPLAAIQSFLGATGGALRIRYSNSVELRTLVAQSIERGDIAGINNMLEWTRNVAKFPPLGAPAPPIYSGRVSDATPLQGGGAALIVIESENVVLRILDPVSADVWVASSGGTFEATTPRSSFTGKKSAASETSGADILDQTITRMLDVHVLGHRPVWAVAAGTLWRSSSERTYIVASHQSDAPILLGGSAHHIWQTLVAERACSVLRLAEVVSARYGVAIEDVESEIGALVEELHTLRLVSLV